MIHDDFRGYERFFGGLKVDGISRRLFKFIGDLSMEKTINGTYFFFERFFFFFSFQKSEESFSLVAWLLFRRMIGWVKLGGADKTPLGRE